MMTQEQINNQLKEWYLTHKYHECNTLEHKEHGKVAHEMLLFYNTSYSFWKKQLINALKENDKKDIKLCINEVQDKIMTVETYKAICNEIDRTR